MSRYLKRFSLQKSASECLALAEAFFQSKGYKIKDYKGERVFHKGNGWASAPKYVKVDFKGNVMVMEGWIRFSIAPHVAAGEFDFNDGSSAGALPKSQMKKEVFEFERQLLMGGYVLADDGKSAKPPKKKKQPAKNPSENVPEEKEKPVQKKAESVPKVEERAVQKTPKNPPREKEEPIHLEKSIPEEKREPIREGIAPGAILQRDDGAATEPVSPKKEEADGMKYFTMASDLD